jgi:hypothetical protein
MPVAIAFVLALALWGVASAAYYGDYCYEAACSPFSSTNSYIQQKAVNIASSNNAAVGDIITIHGSAIRSCDEGRMIQWSVKQVPTLNSSHLTLVGEWCIIGGNQ